jgi:putative hemolysin
MQAALTYAAVALCSMALGGFLAALVIVRRLGGGLGGLLNKITAAEVRALVAGHEGITDDERRLIEEVFAAGTRQLREVFVPRTEVDFIDEATPLNAAARIAAGGPHSRFPVYRGSHDEVIGFVHLRDLLDPDLAGRSVPVSEVVRPVMYLPMGKRVLVALSEMRREGHHLAIVVDEYGGTAGIITLEDLVEELIGDIRDEYDVEDAQARRLHGGAVEVDGLLNLDAFAAETGIVLPEGPYETVAGHIMATLGHVPRAGEVVEFGRHRFAVVEMDGRRVARVRVTPFGDGGESDSWAAGGAAPVTPSEAASDEAASTEA